jgi:hypothetical protein
MPDARTHRGLHPDDASLFAPEAIPALRAATAELSWLYERGYAPGSSLKLVGDRHGLERRQRAAVARCACPQTAVQRRKARSVSPSALRGSTLVIDGFNVITTLEVALSGGIILLGRDGVVRDIASVHGAYRTVEETEPGLALIARLASSMSVSRCVFLLDRPVSNSGRLRALIDAPTRTREVAFRAELVADPDPLLGACEDIIASADGAVLDGCARWFNLARACIEAYMKNARIVDLSSGELD